MKWLLADDNIDCVQKMNRLMSLINEDFRVSGTEAVQSNCSPVFIVGSPRSGTTLLHQIMAIGLKIGYINNFMARFWRAPAVAAHISRNRLRLRPSNHFYSKLGRTQGLEGVHEFGYFWNRFFRGETDHADDILDEDAAVLRREVISMQRTLGMRKLFKNLTCGLRIRPLSKVFDEPVFIEVRRNPYSNAMAILKARRCYHGNENRWWSLEPKNLNELKRLPVHEQIASQIFPVRREIETTASECKVRHIVLHYEDFCLDPDRALEMLAKNLGVDRRRVDLSFEPRYAKPPRTELERKLYELCKEKIAKK